MREARHTLGPVFWIDMGFGNRTLMLTEEAGFEVLRSRSLDSSHMADIGTFLGHSMLTVDGKEHRRMRGASSSAFTPGGLNRAKIGELISATVLRQLEGWKGANELQIVDETKAVALDIIFRMLGVEVDELPEWAHWYSEFLLSAINIPISLPGTPAWRGARARRWLEPRVAAIIEDARERGDHESVVGAMVHGRDKQGAGMSDKELIDNLLILALAGHETTASTLAWSMIYLASSPASWDRLVAEATAMDEVPSDWSALSAQAPFALGVFRESLRLYPPVHLDSRVAQGDIELCGYEIPDQTVVGTSILLVSRNPERYPEPDTWRPERWLELERKPTPVENCQFGGGAHFCLGYHMALLEGALFLTHAARELASQGKRPLFEGQIPRPHYLPLTRPPAKLSIELV